MFLRTCDHLKEDGVLYEIVTALADHRVSHQRASARLFDLEQAAAALRKLGSA